VIKGTTVLGKIHHVPTKGHFVVLSLDMMFFTVIPFLVTVSRNVRLITASAHQDKKRKTVWNALKQVMNLYNSTHSVRSRVFGKEE
jgi:hypothetical protein